MRITEATLAAPRALGPDDRIVVARRDGTRAKFAVRRVERYPKGISPG